MGSTLSVVKTLIIPAVISLILFLLSTFLLVPLWRRYRARYSQYLPLDTISGRASSLRGRFQDALASWVVPSQWRPGAGAGAGGRLAVESDLGYSSEEGEELDDVYDDGGHGGGGGDRRRALSLDARSVHTDSIRRLSRDLEEGFRDDSEEDDDDNDARNRRR